VPNGHTKTGIHTKMNIVGDAIFELAKKVWVRLVACQRHMGKKKWSDGIDVRRLSGEQWLRLLTGETNMAALVGWCASCRTGKCRETTCLHCGAALLLFDEPFWCQTGHKIRLALQKDRTLLSRVKSERENLYGTRCQPMFPVSLEWVLKSWEQTPRPPHRSFDLNAHYLAANSIESLRRLGLSKEEIIDVLSTGDFPNGQVERQGKDYAKIPGEELRKLGEEFRRAVEDVPGSALDLSEMRRTMAWVDRQRAVPMARLKGERVRKRNLVRVRSGPELSKS
jgi:DNA-binding transcriptional MerR regulator